MLAGFGADWQPRPLYIAAGQKKKKPETPIGIQYPYLKEYILNDSRIPNITEAILVKGYWPAWQVWMPQQDDPELSEGGSYSRGLSFG